MHLKSAAPPAAQAVKSPCIRACLARGSTLAYPLTRQESQKCSFALEHDVIVVVQGAWAVGRWRKTRQSSKLCYQVCLVVVVARVGRKPGSTIIVSVDRDEQPCSRAIRA
jgi:hypothetical protein